MSCEKCDISKKNISLNDLIFLIKKYQDEKINSVVSLELFDDGSGGIIYDSFRDDKIRHLIEWNDLKELEVILNNK